MLRRGAGARAGRPGFPPGPDLLGSAKALASFFDDPVQLYVDLRERWGDVVGLRLGSIRLIVVHDLDLVEQLLVRSPRLFHKGHGLKATSFILGNGLITVDGEEHRRNRRIAAPCFSPRNIEPFADATVGIARDMLAGWADGATVQAARDVYDVSLRVAGVGIFGTDFDAEERAQLHRAMRDLNSGYETMVAPGGSAVVASRLTPTARRLHRARATVEEMVWELIAQRRRASDLTELGDLLSRLLAARDEDDGHGFTDRQVRDEAVTMLLAGHDTTAATLGWALAMLATNPDEQRRAQAEVDEVLGRGRAATAADLRRLPFIRAVVDETLRRNPTIYSTVRDPIEPWEAAGMRFPHGVDIVVPIGGIHHDPRWWPDPERFSPDRFLDQDVIAARPKLAYLPFGTGPRVCIGSSFALQELVLVLATIMQSVELRLAPGTQVMAHTGFIRRPEGDLPLVVRRRDGMT